MINQAAFNKEGSISYLSKNHIQLYKRGEHQLIEFFYSTGNLLIKWRFKWLQKEMIYETRFDNVRNLSLLEQKSIGEETLKEMVRRVKIHKINVESGN